MTLPLFTRRPTPVESPALEPDWPETGETWNPEGVTIVQRYYNQSHAVVLVYSTDDGRTGTSYTVACLGCHYASGRCDQRIYNQRYSLTDAGKAANDHATTCRALPRDIPGRPDDATVRERLRSWASGARRRDEEVQLWLSDLDLIRLTLQRSNDWIKAALQQLSVDRPDILRTERSKYSDRIEYYAVARD
ncbi:hypothetical protein [Streptomyces chartreusis]|uniref:hypothetical protein n=1 Tax=Streptomyces chartreusis TaxID=1969 RepID=UPI001677A692|nr:hypothetical protein [Streptomyces chartreusis]GGX58729.1 hypothetical protein GCM10010321_89380 [Streptomyces chartreusis]